jgi:hypothetical protein
MLGYSRLDLVSLSSSGFDLAPGVKSAGLTLSPRVPGLPPTSDMSLRRANCREGPILLKKSKVTSRQKPP